MEIKTIERYLKKSPKWHVAKAKNLISRKTLLSGMYKKKGLVIHIACSLLISPSVTLVSLQLPISPELAKELIESIPKIKDFPDDVKNVLPEIIDGLRQYT